MSFSSDENGQDRNEGEGFEIPPCKYCYETTDRSRFLESFRLGDILERHRDVYKTGVLTDDIIPLCSAFSPQEHGNARRAIDLFRLTGEVARDSDADRIYEEQRLTTFEVG